LDKNGPLSKGPTDLVKVTGEKVTWGIRQKQRRIMVEKQVVHGFESRSEFQKKEERSSR